MNKLVRDGLVAIIVSPGHGAGWYSWHGIEELLFDPSIVTWIESNERAGGHRVHPALGG